MFSCEFSEISNNTLFTEHLWTTAWSKNFYISIGHLELCHLYLQFLEMCSTRDAKIKFLEVQHEPYPQAEVTNFSCYYNITASWGIAV